MLSSRQNLECRKMSWQPSNDPVLGDPKTCDALDLIIVPRTRDLGDGFAVRRALPHGKRQMVGPFIFFDHFGPVQFIAGKGMDVRPHPHIGLATVTYLFDGSIMHRDSEGNVQEIQPGAMNLMTAGPGIAHSEHTPAGRPHHREGREADGDDVPGWRRAGGAAAYLVEFRLLQQGADRAGQTGLENRSFCRRSSGTRVHSAAGVSYCSVFQFAPSRLREDA